AFGFRVNNSVPHVVLPPIDPDLVERRRGNVMGAFVKRSSALCALILLGTTQPGSSPEGRWLTEKKNGVVEIFRCSGGDVLCGRLVWFHLKPGDSNLDLSNSDAQLRNRPLCGLVFMTGFKTAEPKHWEAAPARRGATAASLA